MKANELSYKDLMIGDWVMVRPFSDSEPVKSKITAINYNSYRGKDYTDWVDTEFWDELNLNDIEPIPLTTEILEMNGFSDKYAEDDLSYATDYSGDVIAVHICGKGGIMDEMYLNYVHKLQHALRLCGIEKEIVI